MGKRRDSVPVRRVRVAELHLRDLFDRKRRHKPASFDDVKRPMSMASSYNKNAISAFEEYGVKRGLQPEVEVVSASGPPHRPIFIAVAKLGGRMVCEESGITKHEARMKAAEKSLRMLNTEVANTEDKGRGDADNAARDEDVCPVPDKHPVSALMEYAQNQQLAAPDFNLLSQEGPPHMPAYVMEIYMESRSFRSVKARSLKEAKKKAACVTLNQLNREGKLGKVFAVPFATQLRPANANSNRSSTARNAVSCLNEYSQKNALKLRFETVRESGPSHQRVFEVRATLGGTVYDTVTAANKKEARTLAAEKVLDSLREQKLYVDPPQQANGTSDLYNQQPPNTRNERIAAAALGKLDQLMVAAPLVGRKIVAAVVMTCTENDTVTVVSVGSGNRCVKGDQLRDDGTVLQDSHAEILARRGFKRYLYKLMQERPSNLITRGSTGKWTFCQGVEFHLYVSHAPCGDSALFVHCDHSDLHLNDAEGDKHEPTFTNRRTQGLLRAKQENGEGTIPITPALPQEVKREGTIPIKQEHLEPTFDGLKQGQRLQIMSCSDKICSWNVLGLQGALLSTVFEPVYLKSVIIGSLYHSGHLSRALCCRTDLRSSTFATLLPPGYRVNHPDIGMASMQDRSRAVEKSRPLCLNWSHGDARPEITDGTNGMTIKTLNSPTSSSQLCKKSLFHLFETQIWRSNQSGVTYGIRKLSADDYNSAKLQFKKQMGKQGYGSWIAMPKEVDRFC